MEIPQTLKNIIKTKEDKGPLISYEDIGGLENEIETVREMVELPLKNPDIFRQMGITPPKGLLLYGPPGCGKTLIAKAVAHETNAHFIAVNASDIIRNHYGESEQRLIEIFQEAQDYPYSILFFDEIEAIAPRRDSVEGNVEKRLVSELLALLDGVHERGNIFVLAATNLPNQIDPALRRPGRLDREIAIHPPTKEGRKEILTIYTKKMPLAPSVNLDDVVEMTPGFLGADLAMVCKEAAMHCIQRVTKHAVPNPQVEMKDFNYALQNIEMSTSRDVIREVPSVHWEDIGGLQEAKKRLQLWVSLLAQEQIPKGILLTGAPGTGKTMLAYALATENQSTVNFLMVKGPELLSKWVGDSEKGIRQIFSKAKQASPCILFFDEIDAVLPSRMKSSSDGNMSSRIVNQFLSEIDSLDGKQVLLLAATSRPDLMDTAILRPGRFDIIMNLEKPTMEDRKAILEKIADKSHLDSSCSLEKLAEQTKGFTGADLKALLQLAQFKALEKQSDQHQPLSEWKISDSLLQEAYDEVARRYQVTTSKKNKRLINRQIYSSKTDAEW